MAIKKSKLCKKCLASFLKQKYRSLKYRACLCFFFWLLVYAISTSKLYSSTGTKREKLRLAFNKSATSLRADSLSRSHVKTVSKLRKVIILLSNKRSGTTFAGHLLSENPDVFYLFEPLFPFSRECDVLKKERVNLLQQLINCDLHNLHKEYQNAFQVTKHSDEYAQCLPHNLCFSERHQQLLRKYKIKCGNGKAAVQSKCGFPLKSRILSEICGSSPIVAYKILRVCNFSTLHDLFKSVKNNLNIQLKVLHLIRDPRAILASRLRLQSDETTKFTLQREAIKLCSRVEANVNFADRFWKEEKRFSYLRFRFEDLASHRLRLSENIYQFLGETLPEQVRTWLDKTDVHHMKGDSDPFGMRKRASDVINSWRKMLTFNEVQDIQEKCRSVLTKFNYKTFDTIHKLQDMNWKLIFEDDEKTNSEMIRTKTDISLQEKN